LSSIFHRDFGGSGDIFRLTIESEKSLHCSILGRFRPPVELGT
jgi:hypothetical protein